jgi:hypothetical protein
MVLVDEHLIDMRLARHVMPEDEMSTVGTKVMLSGQKDLKISGERMMGDWYGPLRRKDE